MKKLAIYSVGPLNNGYLGPHTYADVLFPFIKELSKYQVEMTWIGITLENQADNSKLEELEILFDPKYWLSMESYVRRQSKSWDFLDANEFDALLCQPRPLANKLENQILLTLVQKFLDANKPVYCWEVDMYTSDFTDEMREKVTLLHPAQLPTSRFKNEIYFPFFTYNRMDSDETLERDLDFVFIGNIYFRQQQALQFFSQLNDASFKKLVFGSWIQDEERRKFSSQFDNFEFAGSCEHWASIPIMRRTKATLHIVPDFARDRGLMTARVFTSQMARCLCFCDSGIVGAEKFFPKELIVSSGDDIAARWDGVQAERDRLLKERDELLKDYTVENRAIQFMKLLDE